jgi:hypothetical protein
MQFKDQKCQDWLMSLFISFSVNLSITQPLQFVLNFFLKHHDFVLDEHIFLGTNLTKASIIFYKYYLCLSVYLCLNLFKIKQKDNNIPESYVYIDRNRSDTEQLKSFNVDELKKARLLEKKMLSILKEIFIFLLFLFFLYWVTFSNLSQSSYQYNQLFIATFVKQQSQNEMGLENVRIYI